MTEKHAKNQVILVGGATRSIGRAAAIEFGASGATVYCTGRSVIGKTTGRPENINETADLVTGAGGKGIAVQVDHTDPKAVKALIERIEKEQGSLDVLVNNIWGGGELTDRGALFWEHDLRKGLTMLERAINSHIITARYAVPLMISSGGGVIFEITDGNTDEYRGSFFYDLVKTTIMRMAKTMAIELKPHNIAAIAITPGFLRSEAILEHFGVTEENWRNAISKYEPFALSESPYYLARALKVMGADHKVMDKSGQTFAVGDIAEEYGFTDVDGTQPHWQRNNITPGKS
jgi:NAD(P)-dependent dehydrogenase (short-subunit alcohol dehydrogenase family)